MLAKGFEKENLNREKNEKGYEKLRLK